MRRVIMSKVHWDDEIVGIKEGNGYVIYFNWKQEELLRVKSGFEESLEKYYQQFYKIKCETMALNLRELGQQVNFVADRLEKKA